MKGQKFNLFCFILLNKANVLLGIKSASQERPGQEQCINHDYNSKYKQYTKTTVTHHMDIHNTQLTNDICISSHDKLWS